MRKFIAFMGVCIVINANAQFTGHAGVYYLGSANIPINSTIYSNTNISGVVIRFRWNDIEPTPGNFDWSFIDTELAKASANNKKVTLQPLGTPDWLKSIGVTLYYYIDKNKFHSTYGEILSDIIPWDTIYVNRYKIFLQNLAAKYADNTTVSYVNTIGGAFSRGLPDSVLTDTIKLIKQPFWTACKYNADTLSNLMNKMIDYYMDLFPNTPLWCSVDYVTFQTNATKQPINYLASLYTSYGIQNYPDRFGLWREDLSACNPNLSIISSGSHWKILQQNPCRTGAQMLWSVQDGPDRMNKCGIVSNTKAVVLDSAVNNGLALGMRYMEIYGADITDESLLTSIQKANNNLISKDFICNTATISIDKQNISKAYSIYPNPANKLLTIKSDNNQNQIIYIQIYNLTGVLVKEVSTDHTIKIDISDLPVGFYLVKLNANPYLVFRVVKL